VRIYYIIIYSYTMLIYIISSFTTQIFVKLRSQLSEKVSLYWVVIKISFFFYTFNFLMMAVPIVETCGMQQNLIRGSVVTDGLCFFSSVHGMSSTKAVWMSVRILRTTVSWKCTFKTCNDKTNNFTLGGRSTTHRLFLETLMSEGIIFETLMLEGIILSP
jgi:hypothetical protein